MDVRVYECKKCGTKGTLDTDFYTKFIGKKTVIRKIKHSDCNGDGKWLKGETLYIHPKNSFLDGIAEEYGIHMKDYVIVSKLEDEEELKVIGLKRGARRRVFVEVWNPDTKFTWVVPVKDIKKVVTI